MHQLSPVQWYSPFVLGLWLWFWIGAGVFVGKGRVGRLGIIDNFGVVGMSTQPATHGKGSGHWRWQRISALGLIPLTLWFMFAIVAHIGDDYATVVDWIAQPYVSVLLIAYIGFMFFHGQLGMQEIIEDYIHNPILKNICLWVTKAVLIVSALAGFYAIFVVAF